MKMKDIQKLKKKLLQEELRRQGKTRKRTTLIIVLLLLVASLAAGFFWYRVNQEELLEARFVKAQQLLQKEQFAEAADQFNRLYQQNPGFAHASDALFLRADILNRYLGDYQEALVCYLLLERDYPEDARLIEAYRQVAGIYKYRLEDFSRAIEAYQKVQARETESADWVQYEIADSYFRLNNFEQARIEFASLLKTFPDSALAPEVQFRVAVTYALEGQLPEAAGAYQLVAERWPDSPYASEAQFGLAGVLEEQEELQKALQILEQLEKYQNPDVLQQKIEKVRARIAKKKKAI